MILLEIVCFSPLTDYKTTESKTFHRNYSGPKVVEERKRQINTCIRHSDTNMITLKGIAEKKGIEMYCHVFAE